MKKLMIMGAMIGFSTGLLLGVMRGSPWPEVIWRASIFCFASSLLFRWWGRVWLRSLQEAQLQQLAARDLSSAPPAKV